MPPNVPTIPSRATKGTKTAIVNGSVPSVAPRATVGTLSVESGPGSRPQRSKRRDAGGCGNKKVDSTPIRCPRRARHNVWNVEGHRAPGVAGPRRPLAPRRPAAPRRPLPPRRPPARAAPALRPGPRAARGPPGAPAPMDRCARAPTELQLSSPGVPSRVFSNPGREPKSSSPKLWPPHATPASLGHSYAGQVRQEFELGRRDPVDEGSSLVSAPSEASRAVDAGIRSPAVAARIRSRAVAARIRSPAVDARIRTGAS
jgi:hypothetical protein